MIWTFFKTIVLDALFSMLPDLDFKIKTDPYQLKVFVSYIFKCHIMTFDINITIFYWGHRWHFITDIKSPYGTLHSEILVKRWCIIYTYITKVCCCHNIRFLVHVFTHLMLVTSNIHVIRMSIYVFEPFLWCFCYAKHERVMRLIRAIKVTSST